MPIAPYAPVDNIAAEWTLSHAHQRVVSGDSSHTGSPGLKSYELVLTERMRRVHEVLEIVPLGVDPDGHLAVLEATVTAEHAVLSIGDGAFLPSVDFVAFAQDMFPGSRNFSAEEQREYGALVDELYEAVDVDDITR